MDGRVNTEDIALGASKIRSHEGENNRITDFFHGSLTDVIVRDAEGNAVFQEAVTPYRLGSSNNHFNGVEQFVEFEHTEGLELASGGVSLSFNTEDATETQALFSKDNRSFDDGGHITATIEDERIQVRLQSTSRSYYVRSGGVESGRDYDLSVRFGDGGLRLFLDGQLVDQNDYTGGISDNRNPLIIAASQIRASAPGDRLEDFFVGTIGNLEVTDAEGNSIELTPISDDVWSDD